MVALKANEFEIKALIKLYIQSATNLSKVEWKNRMLKKII